MKRVEFKRLDEFSTTTLAPSATTDYSLLISLPHCFRLVHVRNRNSNLTSILCINFGKAKLLHSKKIIASFDAGQAGLLKWMERPFLMLADSRFEPHSISVKYEMLGSEMIG